MSRSISLSDAVKHSIETYFKDLEGEPAHGVYSMVVESVEKTLIEERFSIEYKEYAKVLFMEPAKYSTSDSEYAELVKELAAQFFGGDLDFSAQPIKKRTIGNAGFSSMGPNIEAFHD